MRFGQSAGEVSGGGQYLVTEGTKRKIEALFRKARTLLTTLTGRTHLARAVTPPAVHYLRVTNLTAVSGLYYGALVDYDPAGKTFALQDPVSFTGTTTNLLATVTGIGSTTGYSVGDLITGTGIPNDATILSVDSSTQITLSANATASGTVALTRAVRVWVALPNGATPKLQTYYLARSQQDLAGVGVYGVDDAALLPQPDVDTTSALNGARVEFSATSVPSASLTPLGSWGTTVFNNDDGSGGHHFFTGGGTGMTTTIGRRFLAGGHVELAPAGTFTDATAYLALFRTSAGLPESFPQAIASTHFSTGETARLSVTALVNLDVTNFDGVVLQAFQNSGAAKAPASSSLWMTAAY